MAIFVIYLIATLFLAHVRAHPSGECDVRARTEAGWLCGVRRFTDTAEPTPYASFLGVPYAQQPLGELRFKELQPVEPWDDFYDATAEGPICPQHDAVYGRLMANTNMSEACVHANVHVPAHALPGYSTRGPRALQPPYTAGLGAEPPGLPVLVFIHGGGFACGSGSTDLHGPEFLMAKDIIVITFNYRLNVFGFLSLNSSSVPGNNGLRDIVTLLRWVRENARNFGGDPDDVTIAGQSAGAASAHLLTLSKSTEGLFKRAMLMSGTAIPSFYTTSPLYADLVANLFLSYLGMNTTDPEKIHEKLIALPIETIMDANKKVQDQLGIIAFLPVVESQFPGVTTVLDEDPEILISKGRGSDIPLIIGFTNAECETFRPKFEEIDILGRLKQNPLLILSANLIYKTPPKIALNFAKKIEKRYFDGEPTIDKYIQCCTDTFYVYPAMKLAEKRAFMGRAPTFLYQYSYNADFSSIKEVKGIKFKGAGHIEDLTFMFRSNALEGTQGFSPPSQMDYLMREWMTVLVQRFMRCEEPSCSDNQLAGWPAVEQEVPARFLDISTPGMYILIKPSLDQQSMVQFFDHLQNSTS